MKNIKMYFVFVSVILMSGSVTATTNQQSFYEEIKAGQFPNYFSLFDKKVVEENIDKSMTSILKRVALPYAEDNQIKTIGFMQKVREYAKTSIYISGGVVRTILGYIYKKLHNQAFRFIEGESEEFSNENLKEELSKVFNRLIEGKHRNGEEKTSINPLKVMGVGSDIDFQVDTEEHNFKLVDFINSAERFLNLRDDKSLIKHSVMPIADVKNYDKQLGEGKDSAVAQGGSSLDWLAFSVEMGDDIGQFRFPKNQTDILDNFLKGEIKYYSKTEHTRDSDKQAIRGLRSLFEIPFLQFEEKSLDIICEELSSIKLLSSNAKEQVIKLLRNARFCLGSNRLLKQKTSTDEKIWKILKEKRDLIPIPMYANYKPLPPINDNKNLMDLDEFIKNFTDNGLLYHGTKEFQNYIFILRNGPIMSIQGEEIAGVKWNQGLAVFGTGVYTTPNKKTAEGYAGDNGVIVEFKLRKNPNLKILNITEGDDIKNYVKENFDIIVNMHVIVQNYRCLKIDSSLELLIEKQIQDTKLDLLSIFKEKKKINEGLFKKICLHLNPLNGYSALLKSRENDENIKLLIQANSYLALQETENPDNLLDIIFDYIFKDNIQNKIETYGEYILKALSVDKYNSFEIWYSILSKVSKKSMVLSNLLVEKFPERLLQQDKEGNTFLHRAIKENEEEFAKAIFKKTGKCFGIENKKGETPLDILFDNKQFDLIKYFIEHDEDYVDYQKQDRNGNTFLHQAIKEKEEELAKTIFIKNKKCLGIENKKGQIPLDFAFNAKMFNLARYFVEQDEGCVNYEKKDTGLNQTFLHQAVDAKQEELSKVLFRKNKKVLSLFDSSWQTPVYTAIDKGLLELARYFVENDDNHIDYKHQFKGMVTLLHFAVPYGKENQGLVKVIFEKDKNCLSMQDSPYHQTPFDIVFKNGDFDLVWHFLEQGEKFIDYKSLYSNLGLGFHEAVKKNNEKVIKFLFEKPEELENIINKKDNDNKTLLHIACENNRIDIVKLLLAIKNIDLLSLDRDGYNALHYSIMENNEELVRTLVEKNKNLLNIPCKSYRNRDTYSEIPLKMAQDFQLKEIEKLLIELEEEAKKENK